MARSIEELLRLFGGRREGREMSGDSAIRSPQPASSLSHENEAEMRRAMLPYVAVIVRGAIVLPQTKIPFHRDIREAAVNVPPEETARSQRVKSDDSPCAGRSESAAPAEETPAGADFDRSALAAMTQSLARRLCDAILRAARKARDTVGPNDTR